MQGQENAAQVAKDLGEDAERVLTLSESFETQFIGALDEDFNTAKAMAYLFELVRAVNRFANHKKAKKRGAPVVSGAIAAFRLVSETLGVLTMDVDAFQEEVKNKRCKAMGLSREEIEEKIEARANARANKDWAQSDILRDELDSAGVVLMDSPTGTTWRLRISEAE